MFFLRYFIHVNIEKINNKELTTKLFIGDAEKKGKTQKENFKLLTLFWVEIL